MCQMWVGRILKFLRGGKVPVGGCKVNYQKISLLMAQIYHVVSNREAVYMFIRLPIPSVLWAGFYTCLGTCKLSHNNYLVFLVSPVLSSN